MGYRIPNANAWYGKASTYALQNKATEAARWLRNAIAVNPDLYRVMAQTDTNFSVVIKHPDIQAALHNLPKESEGKSRESLQWQEYCSLEDAPNSALNL